MVCRGYRSQSCSVASAIAAINEPWSSLILEDALFNGSMRFSEFESNLNIAPIIIATRLSEFVDGGVMEMHQNVDSSDLHEYVLTKKGIDLAPSMIALAAWGNIWGDQGDPEPELEHECAGTLEQLLRCHTCGENPLMESVRPRVSGDDEPSETELGDPTGEPDESARSDVRVSVLGMFAIRIDDKFVSPLPNGTQRVLAYLALHENAVTRISMAGTMWPEVSDQSAGASLRSALSRMDAPTREVIMRASGGIGFEASVVVDLRFAQALAHRLLEHEAQPTEEDLNEAAIALLSLDLLPGWYDDWVITEAETWRVLRRNALEAQAGFLSARGRWAEAAAAARVAIAIDPLRESPQACLIKIHIARGNQSEAVKAYNDYRALLKREMGLEPSVHVISLVADIRR
jgi:DNA-binding SARP family transcriptional activator/DNA-binding HxlR family transcriptional regulator